MEMELDEGQNCKIMKKKKKENPGSGAGAVTQAMMASHPQGIFASGNATPTLQKNWNGTRKEKGEE